MEEEKMMEYARDLRSDLKYAFEQGEGQTPTHKDVKVMDWLIEQAKKVEQLEEDCAYWKMKWRDLVELDEDDNVVGLVSPYKYEKTIKSKVVDCGEYKFPPID